MRTRAQHVNLSMDSTALISCALLFIMTLCIYLNVNQSSETVSGLDDAETLFADGLAALRVHRDNYGPDGPKRLQLLWWEFPRQHWTALWEGCRMNFRGIDQCQSGALIERFEDAMRQGLAEGDTIAQLVQRVRGGIRGGLSFRF